MSTSTYKLGVLFTLLFVGVLVLSPAAVLADTPTPTSTSTSTPGPSPTSGSGGGSPASATATPSCVTMNSSGNVLIIPLTYKGWNVGVYDPAAARFFNGDYPDYTWVGGSTRIYLEDPPSSYHAGYGGYPMSTDPSRAGQPGEYWTDDFVVSICPPAAPTPTVTLVPTSTSTPTITPTLSITSTPVSGGYCDHYDIPPSPDTIDIQIGQAYTDNPRLYSEDGTIYVQLPSGNWTSVPYDPGTLLSTYGSGGRVFRFRAFNLRSDGPDENINLPGKLAVCWDTFLTDGGTPTPTLPPVYPTPTLGPGLPSPTPGASYPTPTIRPTYTPLPTYTPYPTYPVPSPTAIPTIGPWPTPTPGPDGTIVPGPVVFPTRGIDENELTIPTAISFMCEREPCHSARVVGSGVGDMIGDIANNTHAPTCDLSLVTFSQTDSPYQIPRTGIYSGLCWFVDRTESFRHFMRLVSVAFFMFTMYKYWMWTIRRLGDV